MSTFREDIISPCEKELMSDQLKCTRTRLHQWSHSELCPMSLTPTTVMIIVGGTWILALSWPTRSASTTHALVDVLQHSNKALDEGKSGAADAEVIDHVDHNILLKKLRNNDVPKFIINCENVSNDSRLLTCCQTGSGNTTELTAWLIIFLTLTDDLRLQLPTHKHADDTAVSETVNKDEITWMHFGFSYLLTNMLMILQSLKLWISMRSLGCTHLMMNW